MSRTAQDTGRDLPLFAAPIDTRRAAYDRLAGELDKLQTAVLRFVAECGDRGATDEQIRKALKLRGDTSRARRCELRDVGLIVDSQRTRPTSSGRSAIIWRLADELVTAAALESDQADTPTADRTADRVEGARPGVIGLGRPGLMCDRGKIGRCCWCGSDQSWISIHGRRICRQCHPPATPNLVAKAQGAMALPTDPPAMRRGAEDSGRGAGGRLDPGEVCVPARRPHAARGVEPAGTDGNVGD